MIDPNSKEARWELARTLLCREVPYLASAIWALRGPYWRTGLGTAGISSDLRVYIDPTLVLNMERTAVAALIEHEVWHALLEHFARIGDRDVMQWNIAGDCEIHAGHLRSTSLEQLEGSVTSTNLGLADGKTAEYYYDHITITKIQLPSGSAADGVPRDYEEAQPGDVVTEGATRAERRAIIRDVAQQIQQLKEQGDLPVGLGRWAAQVLGPSVVDWRVLYRQSLHAAVARRAGAVDYTYARPARRDAGARRGYISPGLFRPVPEVAAIIDTSGSMTAEDLGVVVREIVGLARAVGAKVRIASCDAEVYSWQYYTPRLHLEGGGGTDMRRGIDVAARLHPTPHIIVVCTDGETPWPDTAPPGIAVIAVLTHSTHAHIPEWITPIVITKS